MTASFSTTVEAIVAIIILCSTVILAIRAFADDILDHTYVRIAIGCASIHAFFSMIMGLSYTMGTNKFLFLSTITLSSLPLCYVATAWLGYYTSLKTGATMRSFYKIDDDRTFTFFYIVIITSAILSNAFGIGFPNIVNATAAGSQAFFLIGIFVALLPGIASVALLYWIATLDADWTISDKTRFKHILRLFVCLSLWMVRMCTYLMFGVAPNEAIISWDYIIIDVPLFISYWYYAQFYKAIDLEPNTTPGMYEDL
ncbi:hypothetical protein PCE1_003137 [Barthelona sp. PCE]